MHTSIPPVHRLPIEILEEVFLNGLCLYCPASNLSHGARVWEQHVVPCPSMVSCPNNCSTWRNINSFTPAESSLGVGETFQEVVSQVCSSWRSIALSCGALWSQVHFDSSQPSINRLELWLNRAGKRYLEITVNFRHHTTPCLESRISKKHPLNVKLVLSVLHRYWSRSHTITLQALCHHVIMDFVRTGGTGERFKSLRSLKILQYGRCRCIHYPHHLVPYITYFVGASKQLSQMALMGSGFRWLGVPELPNLTELILHLDKQRNRLSWNQFTRTLETCSHIETLVIRGCPFRPESGIETSSGIIIMPSLLHLDIQDHFEKALLPFVRKLLAPRLSSMCLRITLGNASQICEAISEVRDGQHSLASGLSKLAVALHGSANAVRILFQSARLLEKLVVDEVDGNLQPQLAQEICASRTTTKGGQGNEGVWFPRLVELIVKSSSPISLQSFLEDRIERGVPLKFVWYITEARDSGIEVKVHEWMVENLEHYRETHQLEEMLF